MLPWMDLGMESQVATAEQIDARTARDFEQIMDISAIYEHAISRISKGTNPRTGKPLNDNQQPDEA